MKATAPFACSARPPSAAAELAWLVDLLVQNARYAEPALDELDQSLLPGVARLRPLIKERYASMWDDEVGGCPELLVVAHDAGCVEDHDPSRLLHLLSTGPTRPLHRHAVLDAPAPERRSVRRRLLTLHNEVGLRRRYRDILAEVWRVAEPRWSKFGRAAAGKASAGWARRLRRVDDARGLGALMPPRHPLSRTGEQFDELLRRRRRFTIVPVYFCMSGGQVTDLDSVVNIGVPASAVEPIRRTRDALFVAERARVLAEPTRVRILIHLLSKPAGVMQMTRALGLGQPTVSEHVRILVRAGLVVRHARGSGAVYSASSRAAGRWVEDIGATLMRWS